jgi:glycine/D-amino acid oxidase-like deaminating enzyme
MSRPDDAADVEAAKAAAPADADVVIVGGGIAGLWLHNLLAADGYRTILLEADQLGCGQTLASQGMIHGGLKYALGGRRTGASEAIAGMPARWRRCLAGDGDIDLRPLRPLADRYLLFAEASALGRLTGFFASRALRGRIRPLPVDEYPAALAHPGFRGVAYALDELVLDTPALLEHLRTRSRGGIYRHRVDPGDLAAEADAVCVRTAAGAIRARRLVVCAGTGAERLLAGVDLPVPRMQRRPLHQVVVRCPDLPPLYAHCLTGIRRAEPRLTITAHPDDGGWLWYLGGQLAGDGVAMDPPALIAHARAELEACVPWLDWRLADLTTLRIDRAEPAQTRGHRPDQAFAAPAGPIIVAWPTKLSLTPDLGDRVRALLPPPEGGPAPSLALPPATVGTAPWQAADRAVA